jgi:hypothetical protein
MKNQGYLLGLGSLPYPCEPVRGYPSLPVLSVARFRGSAPVPVFAARRARAWSGRAREGRRGKCGDVPLFCLFVGDEENSERERRFTF